MEKSRWAKITKRNESKQAGWLRWKCRFQESAPFQEARLSPWEWKKAMLDLGCFFWGNRPMKQNTLRLFAWCFNTFQYRSILKCFTVAETINTLTSTARYSYNSQPVTMSSVRINCRMVQWGPIYETSCTILCCLTFELPSNLVSKKRFAKNSHTSWQRLYLQCSFWHRGPGPSWMGHLLWQVSYRWVILNGSRLGGGRACPNSQRNCFCNFSSADSTHIQKSSSGHAQSRLVIDWDNVR